MRWCRRLWPYEYETRRYSPWTINITINIPDQNNNNMNLLTLYILQ